MASINAFDVSSWVTMNGLELLTNDLAVAPYFNTDWDENFEKDFAVGATITVPLPQRYLVQRNDMTYNPQGLSRPTTTITVDQTATIPFEYEPIERALQMERGDERVRSIYLQPAIDYIRQAIDSDCAQFAAQNANMVTGTLGTNPTTYDATSAACNQALFDMSCPDTDLGLFITSGVNRAVKNTGLVFFNPATDLSKQFRKGFVEYADGFDWYRSNSLYTHTAGTWAGNVTVTSFAGNQLVVACTTGDTFMKGDVVSIANVNQVNLMTRNTTSTSTAGTKTFKVLQAVTGAASAATLTVYPALAGPGQQNQNVDALPAVGAALTLWPGTATPNGKSGKLGLALYKDSFMLVGVKMALPSGVEAASNIQDPKTKIAIHHVRQWDNVNYRWTNRLDSLWGRGVGLAESCAVVLAGA